MTHQSLAEELRIIAERYIDSKQRALPTEEIYQFIIQECRKAAEEDIPKGSVVFILFSGVYDNNLPEECFYSNGGIRDKLRSNGFKHTLSYKLDGKLHVVIIWSDLCPKKEVSIEINLPALIKSTS